MGIARDGERERTMEGKGNYVMFEAGALEALKGLSIEGSSSPMHSDRSDTSKASSSGGSQRSGTRKVRLSDGQTVEVSLPSEREWGSEGGAAEGGAAEGVGNRVTRSVEWADDKRAAGSALDGSVQEINAAGRKQTGGGGRPLSRLSVKEMRARPSSARTGPRPTSSAASQSSYTSFSYLVKGSGNGGYNNVLSQRKVIDVGTPPSAGAWKSNLSMCTAPDFRRFYDRGDLPCIVEHGAHRNLHFLVDPDKLDYHYYLPLFMDGIREQTEPYKFIANEGVRVLLKKGETNYKVLATIPQLIIPLRAALITKIPAAMLSACEIIQSICHLGNGCGEALVPYYRQLLPMMRQFMEKNANLGDEFDTKSLKHQRLADVIAETLEAMERSGGEDAFVNLKYMIPSFESAITG